MSIEPARRRNAGPAPIALTGVLGLALLIAGCGGTPAKTDAKVEPLDAAGQAAFKAQMDQINAEEKAHQDKDKAENPSKDGSGSVDDEERKMRRKGQ